MLFVTILVFYSQFDLINYKYWLDHNIQAQYFNLYPILDRIINFKYNFITLMQVFSNYYFRKDYFSNLIFVPDY